MYNIIELLIDHCVCSHVYYIGKLCVYLCLSYVPINVQYNYFVVNYKSKAQALVDKLEA